MRRVLVVQRRRVGEPKEYLETEFLLPKSGVVVAQRVPEVSMGKYEEVSERTNRSLEGSRKDFVQFFREKEVMGVDEASQRFLGVVS